MHWRDTRDFAPWAAAGLPLLFYALGASGYGYWLDSAEFAAAAIQLDIPHPPGHPLFALWSKPFTWLPIGPLQLRVALAQAVAAGAALWFVQRALARSVRQLGLIQPWHQAGISLGCTWMLGGAYGWYFQAVRAEVYALQALLVAIALERVSLWACTREARDPRALFAACLALGLGLANHHFIAVLALPTLLWPALSALRAHGPRALALSALFGSLGALAYAYLPLRALQEPPMDLGAPTNVRDFAWVVSAQVYARRIGTGALQPLGERFADLLVILVENFPLLLLAPLGAYALLRTPRTRPLAALWLSAAVTSLCGRAWLNEVRANPDVLGYMMPGFFALVALIACGVAALCIVARGRVRVLSHGLVALLVLLGALTLERTHAQHGLSDFQATDAFDDARRRGLPAGSVLVLTTPDSVFRHWEGEAVEQLRADIAMLPLPFLGYGGVDDVWLRRDPSLRPLAEAFSRDGVLSPQAIAAVARTRPVFVELDSTTTLPLYPSMIQDGLLYRESGPARDAAAFRRRLRARVGCDVREPETRRVLLWNLYVEALYHAARGELGSAREAVLAGLTLSPETRELRALHAALQVARQGGAEGPLDIRAFLVRAP